MTGTEHGCIIITDQISRFSRCSPCVNALAEHLYVAARVINTICVYDIDQGSGRLRHTQTVLCSGGGVRMLCPSPDGKFMLASYPYDNKVEVYSVCGDGRLGEIRDVFIQPTLATLNFFQDVNIQEQE